MFRWGVECLLPVLPGYEGIVLFSVLFLILALFLFDRQNFRPCAIHYWLLLICSTILSIRLYIRCLYLYQSVCPFVRCSSFRPVRPSIRLSVPVVCSTRPVRTPISASSRRPSLSGLAGSSDRRPGTRSLSMGRHHFRIRTSDAYAPLTHRRAGRQQSASRTWHATRTVRAHTRNAHSWHASSGQSADVSGDTESLRTLDNPVFAWATGYGSLGALCVYCVSFDELVTRDAFEVSALTFALFIW